MDDEGIIDDVDKSSGVYDRDVKEIIVEWRAGNNIECVTSLSLKLQLDAHRSSRNNGVKDGICGMVSKE